MFPLSVYNAFFTEVLLELTERFCAAPQKFWQEMVDIPIIGSICLHHKNHFINIHSLGWKYNFTFELYEL